METVPSAWVVDAARSSAQHEMREAHTPSRVTRWPLSSRMDTVASIERSGATVSTENPIWCPNNSKFELSGPKKWVTATSTSRSAESEVGESPESVSRSTESTRRARQTRGLSLGQESQDSLRVSRVPRGTPLISRVSRGKTQSRGGAARILGGSRGDIHCACETAPRHRRAHKGTHACICAHAAQRHT